MSIKSDEHPNLHEMSNKKMWWDGQMLKYDTMKEELNELLTELEEEIIYCELMEKENIKYRRYDLCANYRVMQKIYKSVCKDIRNILK